jgi:high-affinity iron transporter
MTYKRTINLDTIKVAPSISHDTVITSSIVIIHLLIFSLFSTNYLVNAQNDNNNLTSTNSILTRASNNNNTRLNTTDAFIVLFNLQRIQTQLDLSRDALNKDDSYAAFAHAYIPHSVIYPSIRNLVEQVNKNGSISTTKKLESALTDIPFMIKSGSSINGVRDAIAKDKYLLNSISSNIAESIPNAYRIPVMLQTAVFLLRDAEKSYQLSNASSSTGSYSNNVGQNNKDLGKQRQLSQIDYENAIGLVNTSKSIYGQIFASVGNSNNSNRNSEIELSLNQLDYLLRSRSNDQLVLKLVNSIEQNTIGQSLLNSPSSNPASNSLSGPPNNQHIQYFATIRNLLQSLIVDVKKGDYISAEQAAINAYLDNFEYLEPPIEKHDFKLKSDIELAMREQLRQMIKDKMPSDKITSFVNSILSNIDKAQSLLNSDSSLYRGSTTSGNSGLTIPALPNMRSSSSGAIKNEETFADIQTLSKGFGVYTGERKSMGQASDASKVSVRNNIDQIRSSLEDMLKQYSKGSYGDALSTSRSAYLDSYENIEVPLRPINPDFTLDMEIKFAELRNLIFAKASYERVQEKTFEIRQGLDESERLVSGSGVIAPTIAFSTSFSIIFREGLESALIVGAILTYLEASRNEQFKKHVYYGIAIAVLATAVTWFIAQYIIEISGINRELIEAIAGISAVAVLFWVSFWVLNKVETKKWIEFVKAKVWKATTTGSVLVFVMLSFFTVYREGFETVLFYQAMLSFAKYMEFYVIAGLTLGIVIIVGVVFLIRKLGKKLPLRVLFGLTMGIGAYMSIAFMGNTIRSFQEAGYIPITDMIGTVPRLDINISNMTGIHPTLETIVAQSVLLSVYLVGSFYILILQPKRKKAIEISRKSMSDMEKSRKRGGQ